MSERALEFWEKTLNKVYWLGIALVGVLTANTIVNIYKDSKKDLVETDADRSPRKANKYRKVKFESDTDIKEKVAPAEEGLKSDVIAEDTYQKRKGSFDVKSTKALTGPTNKSNTTVYTICFTGGPCAGKTTAISNCAEKLKELGWPVICVPEAATLIFSSGGVLNMETYTPYQAIEFQKCLMKLQISLEDVFTNLVKINSNKDMCIVLCDRGLMDGSAYISKEQWDVLLNEVGIYESDIKDHRYDLVIHLTTAADGAQKYYQIENNVARHENVSFAVDLDRKLRKAWCNHPNYFLITNDFPDFKSKINQAEEYVLKSIGCPIYTEFSKKYLMKAKGQIFEQIILQSGVEMFIITDTFLERGTVLDQDQTFASTSHDEVIYIRKREHNSRLTFLKGKRTYAEKEVYFSTKRNILWKEYTSYIEMYKDKSTNIVRKRCMNIFDQMYLQFEFFSINGAEFIIATVQTSDSFLKKSQDDQKSILENSLPKFIHNNIIADITDNKEYRLERMAQPDWRLSEELLQKIS